MPLINIRTTPSLFPTGTSTKGRGTAAQQSIEEFGASLPDMFVLNSAKLGMTEDTPPAAVQVDYERFHTKAVNAPDLWVMIRFAEPYPGKKKAKKVVRVISRMFDNWFDVTDALKPGIAVDCFWGPTHGYLAFGSTNETW